MEEWCILQVVGESVQTLGYVWAPDESGGYQRSKEQIRLRRPGARACRPPGATHAASINVKCMADEKISPGLCRERAKSCREMKDRSRRDAHSGPAWKSCSQPGCP